MKFETECHLMCGSDDVKKTKFLARPLVYFRVPYLSEGHLSYMYLECTAKDRDRFQSPTNTFVGPSVHQARSTNTAECY